MHIAQAGAVAFKKTERGLLFLVVRAKKNPNHWIFPKGHVEDGETSETAALRELREEGCILATLVDHLGANNFWNEGQSVRVDYYLCEFQGDVTDCEERERRWCPPREALDMISFSDARALLSQAVDRLASH
jgi:bis(5'-nucleosidyl)-tetraphosphatase